MNLAKRLSFSITAALALAACNPPPPSGYTRPAPEESASTEYRFPLPEPGERLRFRNLDRTYESKATVFDWLRHAAIITFSQYPEADRLPDNHVMDPREAARDFAASRDADFAITWMGHASFLIRAGGKKILTDPVFDHTLGPGTSRLVPVLPDPDLIERVDAIVLSHADQDHFNQRTLRELAARFPDTRVHVPRATGGLAQWQGFRNVYEHEYYGSITSEDVRITAVPAVHGLRRPPFAPNSMSWAGFMIEAPQGRIYFAGDTGMGDIYRQMRAHFGPVDVALMPAGAWAPRDFQKGSHVNPEEAMEIAGILDAGLSIGMHWGTYPLSPEPPTEQKRRFLAAGTEANPNMFMRIGETRVLDGDRRLAAHD